MQRLLSLSLFIIVVDNGSGLIKAGNAGDDAPRVVFSSIVGYPKQPNGKSFYVGDDAMANQNILDLKAPIERGFVTNWDDMEKVWNHTFLNELRINPSECNVLLTEAPLTPEADQAKMAEIMFQTFSTKAIAIANQAVLSLYASGRTTGLVVETGYGVTNIVTIYEGVPIQDAILRFDMGGGDLTDYMMLLNERGYTFTTADRGIVSEIKERLCYVASSFQEELDAFNSASEIKTETSSGQNIVVGTESIRVPEAMFQPSLIGVESVGIHELIYQSILKCERRYRRALSNQIILAGGNSLFRNMGDRLVNELNKLAPTTSFKVVSEPARKYSTWIGGSNLASSLSFEAAWITKDEYTELGSSIIQQKKL